MAWRPPLPTPSVALGVACLVWAAPLSPLGCALVVAYVVGAFARDLSWLWRGLMLLAALVLWCDWLSWASGYRLLNPNLIGCGIALALAAAIALREWWFFPIACVGLWWTESRAAMLGAGAACLVGLWRIAPATAMCAALLALVGVAEVHKADVNLVMRLGIWQDTIDHLTIWGHGWGSFASAYASWPIHRNMTLALAPHAYNDYLELIFELGMGSALIWFWIASHTGHDPVARLVLWAFAAMSLFYFPFYILGPVAALALGHLSRKDPIYGTLAPHHFPLPQRP